MPTRKPPRRAKPSAPPTPSPRTGGRPKPSVGTARLAGVLRELSVLSEAPHAHIVCRSCGRIAEVPLDTHDALTLERMAERRPDGWSVDLVAFSLTGACARCRQGPVAPG